jgi:cardiolipin synthase (CMP-forming)
VNLSALPNAICVGRMLLIVPISVALTRGSYSLALALFVVAGLSDALDGYLAKRFGWTSELGGILDPLADKLLLMTMFVVLAVAGQIPVWLAATAVGRDVLIVGGAVVYRLHTGALRGEPTRISKLNTLLQLCYVLAVIAGRAWPYVPGWLIVATGAGAFVTTVVSGLDYVLTYARRAARTERPAGA